MILSVRWRKLNIIPRNYLRSNTKNEFFCKSNQWELAINWRRFEAQRKLFYLTNVFVKQPLARGDTKNSSTYSLLYRFEFHRSFREVKTFNFVYSFQMKYHNQFFAWDWSEVIPVTGCPAAFAFSTLDWCGSPGSFSIQLSWPHLRIWKACIMKHFSWGVFFFSPTRVPEHSR